MSIPLHLAHGPHGLVTIAFRQSLIYVDLDKTEVHCHEAVARPGLYWLALSVGVSQYADAFCTAPTKAERNEAIRWLRDMAAVLKGGET
jgi:hypothetical protein